MKLKFLPEDFLVEELPSVSLDDAGDYSFYRLRKRSRTTPDAIQAVAKRWKVPAKHVSFGGLKDRHAVTIQYFTLPNGPRKKLSDSGIEVEYLGQVLYPYRSEDFEGNRFRVTLRDMTAGEIDSASAALDEIESLGVANYFDDQRFGSVSPGGPFIAREMVEGRFEAALRLATTSEYEHDRAEAKREKAILAECWGKWDRCGPLLRKSPNRNVWTYLAYHPDDFRGAILRLHPELQGLYLAAYQSHLWNRVLAEWVRANAEDVSSLELKLGAFPSPKRMAGEKLPMWESLEIPLPSARLRLPEESPLRPLFEKVFGEEELTLERMKIPGVRQPFFSKGVRAACLRPRNLSRASEDDEHHAGRGKMTLGFELPRAAYATMVVKQVTSL